MLSLLRVKLSFMFFIDHIQNFVALVNETNEMGSNLSLDKVANGKMSAPRWSIVGVDRKLSVAAAAVDGVLLHHLVLDLSRVCFIDSVGAKILKQVRVVTYYY